MAILLWTSYRLRIDTRTGPPTDKASSSVTSIPPFDPLPPTAPLLPLSLFTSSMAFFLFSFQVHEKSILLPLLSVYLVLGDKESSPPSRQSLKTPASFWPSSHWNAAVLLLNVATFSMFPLLHKDHLSLQYAVTLVGWNWAVGYDPRRVKEAELRWLGYVSPLLFLCLCRCPD